MGAKAAALGIVDVPMFVKKVSRPMWSAVSDGLSAGVSTPCDSVVVRTPGDYTAYFAANPTTGVLVYLDIVPREYALVKLTDSVDADLAAGDATFLYKE